MAKHKGRNMRKARIKKHDRKILKSKSKVEGLLTRLEKLDNKRERKEMSKRIKDLCPENSKSLNDDLGEYYSNLDTGFKDAFNELINQMESGEIYE